MTVGAKPASGDKIVVTFEKMDGGQMGILSTSGTIDGRLNLPPGEVPIVYPVYGSLTLEVLDQNAALHGLNLVRAAIAYCDFMHAGWRGRPEAGLDATAMTVQARNLFKALRAAAGIPEPPADA